MLPESDRHFSAILNRTSFRIVIAAITLIVPIILAVIAGGVTDVPLYLPIIVAPAGILLLLQRKYDKSVLASISIILAGSAGLLEGHLINPNRAPLLDVWIPATCGALSFQGIVQYIIKSNPLERLRPEIVALILPFSLCIASAIVASEAPDVSWTPGAEIFIGLPFLFLSSFFGRSYSYLANGLYIAGVLLLCILCEALFFAMINPPHALFSKVHISTYILSLNFDLERQAFKAEEWIGVEFSWSDDHDVVRMAEQPFTSPT